MSHAYMRTFSLRIFPMVVLVTHTPSAATAHIPTHTHSSCSYFPIRLHYACVCVCVYVLTFVRCAVIARALATRCMTVFYRESAKALR